MLVNQAVVFTKPIHHLGVGLSPGRLDELAGRYFSAQGVEWVFSKTITGPQLAQRDIIKQHYLIYSQAACAATAEELAITDSGKERFEAAFWVAWDAEVAAGRIMGTAQLLQNKGIDVQQLFSLWNGLFAAGKTAKLQDGLIMAYLEGLDAYCVNAFYPSMEANFYNPNTEIHYHVVEFDPAQVSWKTFRQKVLGATNSSNAVPESFRGQLYAEYPVEFPGRDNFVHGSAGPFEGLVERAIHEPGFELNSNPVGVYLSERGITLDAFKQWKEKQSISAMGKLFDATEAKNTAEVFPILDRVPY